MKNHRRGSRQGARRSENRRQSARSKERNRLRRVASDAASARGSARRRVNESVGTLDRSDALAALATMGIAVDNDGPADMAEARKIAEGAAASAARALGIEILNPDGSIDTVKAREAVSQVVGFDLDGGGSPEQASAVERANQAAIRAAAAMNADIRDAAGNIDSGKAQRVASLALELRVAKAKRLGRRETLDALNISLDAMTSTNPQSRRAASAAMEQLLSSSVLVVGQVDRRAALDALENRLPQP